jgi:hypothetical protein
MKKLYCKTKLSTIALVLILTVSAMLVALPTVSAHDPPLSIATFAYISVAPSTIGVNQQVLLYFWIHQNPPTGSGAYGDRWHNYEVEVTAPDGSKENLGPYDSDPIGFAWAPYTPTQVGTYTFQFSFHGQTLAGENLDPNDMTGRDYIGDYFEPSTSEPVTLTVLEDQIETYPSTSLPTEYWERPIDAQHRDWWSISGNWLNAPGRNWVPPNRYVKYSTAPASSHILWTRELTFGGLVGGEFDAHSFHCGNAYEGKWMPPVMIAGKLFYNENPDDIYYGRQTEPYIRDAPKPGVYCVDLRTGEEIWYTDDFRLDFGQVYMYDSPNQHGAFAYLWEVKGSTWNCFDAFTKDWIYTIENVPGGTHVPGLDGSIYHYQLNTQGNWLALWSSTAIPELAGGPTGTAAWQWRPQGKTVDGANGYLWNITISADIKGGINAVYPGDMIIGSSGLGSAAGRVNMGTNDYSLWCLSLKSGEEGKLLWKKDYTGDGDATLDFGAASPEDGVFTLWSSQALQHWGFDINTGDAIWGPTEKEASWQMTVGSGRGIAYGKLFSTGYAGIVYCYDAMTGELEWDLPVECPYYLESMWGSNYIIDEFLVADGKLFAFCGEHSPNDPKERGSPTVCIDVNTGEELWRIPFYCSHWSRNPSIADGIIAFLNTYDNRIYAIGKGQTETTVSAMPKVTTKGSSVVIEGTVTDQSAGAVGTPAISDASMDEWMKYLYMQFPMPMDAVGVEVTLDAIDPDGAFINIGRTTSDMSGFFSHQWTPEKEGKYTIIATFEGSNSYWSSYAETAVGVDPAPSPETPITPEPEPEAPLITTEIAIVLAVVAVAVIGIVGYWVLKKRQ